MTAGTLQPATVGLVGSKLRELLVGTRQACVGHGIERVRLEGLGRPAPYVDGQIAAIAYVNELTLVTAHVKDFARFKGVDVENWSKRRG